MGDRPPKKSKWRWVRRGLLALTVVILLLGAAAFMFTTQAARWAARRSSYAKFSPEIGSAALSFGGELTLGNVVLHELPPHGERLLLKAPRLRVSFSWWDALHARVRDIQAEDVTVYARPGEAGTGEAITLLELAGADSAEAVNRGPPIGAAAEGQDDPFWFDTLACEGQVEVEGFAGPNMAGGSFPLKLGMQMRGDRGAPARDLSVDIGEPDGKTQVSARMRFEPQAGGERIVIESCRARGLHAGISDALAKRALATWPKMFQQALDGEVATFSATGTIDGAGAGATFSGKIEVGGASMASQAGAAAPIEVKGIAFSGSGGGPLGAAFLSKGSVSGGNIGIEAASFGKNKVQHFQTPVTLSGGVLEAAQVKGTFAGGDFSGLVRYSTGEKKLISGKFSVEHLDQKQVAANIAPDRIDAQGTLSGTIELSGTATGGLSGRVDLASDGPGRLQIKDQQTAEALAKKLQTGDISGVLPASFSDIVVEQLKDYPYKTGRIRLQDRDGVPVLSLDYVREGVKAGEPGYGVQTTIGGQKVLANYTIQLPGVAIVLQGMTIEELLGRATGLMQEIAGKKPGQ